MALKKINVSVAQAEPAKKSDTPVVTIPNKVVRVAKVHVPILADGTEGEPEEIFEEQEVLSNIIANYNKAYDAVKDAEGVLNDLKPEIIKIASKELAVRNNKSKAGVLATVKIKDGVGEMLRVSVQDKYSVMTAEGAETVVELLEERFKKDANDYLVETVVAKFDSSVFLKDGQFDETIYAAFKTAIDAVATAKGVRSPLNTVAVTQVKSDFNERRHQDFTIEQNLELMNYVKQTITVTPAKA